MDGRKLSTRDSGNNWLFQWSTFINDADFIEIDYFLFREWIYPNTIEDFKGKVVLDCGCGRGQHLKFLLPYISSGMGIDLNTGTLANKYINSDRVRTLNADLATVSLPDKYDIVYSIGVLHHTDDPSKTFNNIKRFLRPGGRMIIWVYSYEGNFLNRILLEPLNRYLFSKLNPNILLFISFLITIIMYMPIYTLYILPLAFLPFFEYFRNFRKLSFRRNCLNVFDKINAPQTHFISRETVESWFNDNEFSDIHISFYSGISWRASGVLKQKG